MDSEIAKTFRRARLLNLSWFESAHDLLGPDARPLSLGSSHALRVIDLRWLDSAQDLSLEEESRELALYAWLHTAPIRDVCVALWQGSWRSIAQQAPDVPDIVRAHLRMERDNLMAVLDAAAIQERPKPQTGGKSQTPRDVIAPSTLTYRLVKVCQGLQISREEALWHVPLVQAIQVYHAARWEEGVWTVRPGEEITEAQVADLEPDWMRSASEGVEL